MSYYAKLNVAQYISEHNLFSGAIHGKFTRDQNI